MLALDNVSLDLNQGELLGLIGTNGAGKSTLFSVITGYVPSRAGVVQFDGRDISHMAVHTRVRQGLARTFQVPREFSQLTVMANMMAAAPDAQGEKLLSIFFNPRKVQREEEQVAERARDLLQFLN
ncbi:MAG: ATP-binding cassette domain-containing protein, partial [Achromobacter mucicolens]